MRRRQSGAVGPGRAGSQDRSGGLGGSVFYSFVEATFCRSFLTRRPVIGDPVHHLLLYISNNEG